MVRRALLLLAIAGIYLAATRRRKTGAQSVNDRMAEARWANEGGAISAAADRAAERQL